MVSDLQATLKLQKNEFKSELRKRDTHIDFLRHEYSSLSHRLRTIENIFRMIPNTINKHSKHEEAQEHHGHHGHHEVHADRSLRRTHTGKSHKSAYEEHSGNDEDEFFSLDGYESEEDVVPMNTYALITPPGCS